MIESLETLKNKLAAFFETRDEILFAYLFGSTVTGRTTPLSDIDIAVFINPSKILKGTYRYDYASYLTSALMGLLQTNRTDLVVLNDAPPLLQHRIFTQGLRIFCRESETEKCAFVRAIHQYQDTAPLRRIQAYYLNRYLKGLGPTRSHG